MKYNEMHLRSGSLPERWVYEHELNENGPGIDVCTP